MVANNSIKRSFQLLISCYFLSQCAVSTESEIPISKEGFHYSEMDLSKVIPYGLIENESEYHLVYSNEDTWAQASSNDLINWSFTRKIPISAQSSGGIVIDEANQSGLGGIDQQPWLIYYEEDGEISLKYSLDKTNWIDANIDIPEEVVGAPHISKRPDTEEWILTVSKGQVASILVSNDLITWRKMTELTLPSDRKALLTFVNDRCIVMTGGKDPVYAVGRIESNKFIIESSFKPFKLFSEDLDLTVGLISNIPTMIHTVGNRILGIAKSIDLSDTAISLVPSEKITNVTATKRRGKLSKLKGETSSRFTFSIDGFQEGFSIRLFNEQGESLIVGFDNGFLIDKTKASSAFDGERVNLDWDLDGNEVQFDVIIDYAAIEVVINDGEIVIPLEVNSVFIYNQIEVTVDQRKYDARAVIYTLDKSLI